MELSAPFAGAPALCGPLRRPRQMLADQKYDGHKSIHYDATAGKLISDGSPSAGKASGRSGEPVPVILITYATTEDAVRKALAAVGRDKVISGKPQVIRIEKN